MASSTTMQTVILRVSLHCEGCERRVKKAIWQLRGVTSVQIDTKQEKVTVTGFVDPAKVLKAIKKTGKPVEIYNNKYQAGNNKIPYLVNPTKFGNAGGGETKGTSDSKKHSQQQFSSSTKKQQQQQPRHKESDYYSDADSDYGSSFSKLKHQNSNKFSGSVNKSSKKDQKSSFKDHSKLQPQYQEEFDFDDFESDEENDFSYGNQKSSFHNPKTNGGFDNSTQKSSLKQSAGFPGFGSQKQSSQADFEYSGGKSAHSGYDGNSHNKSTSLYSYVPSNGNEHKSSEKSSYGYPSGNINEQLKSHNKSSYSYAPNTHSEHHNSQSSGNKSQYPASYNENKPQKKQQQQQQKFVSFDDEYEPHQQPKYRPEPQLVKQQQRSSNRDEDYGYEQKFYTAYGQEPSYRPTYSYAYHEPNYRLPPATGSFSNMFSEENPNACSIM